MEWKGQAAWQSSPETEWTANGVHAGSVKAAGPLSFVKVAGAGHMVRWASMGSDGEMGSDGLSWLDGI